MFWWRKKLLYDYEKSIEEIKTAALTWGLSQEEINFTVHEAEALARQRHRTPPQETLEDASPMSKWVRFGSILLIILAICCGFQYYKPAHNFVERNIQEAIYPFMQFYRRLTLPIIQQVPVLSELYDESCLVENPYFQVTDMDCWPCEKARFVMNLTESISNAHVGLPFVMKYTSPAVTLRSLSDAYSANKELIDNNSPRIHSNAGWSNIGEVLEANEDSLLDNPSFHVTWRINRMEVGRILRSLLKPPRDGDVPPHATSIGIERFLLFDGPSSPHYLLPPTEGANVFLKQLTGQRLIVLEPAPECRQSCRRLSFLLEESHILWYNWFYWRPRSLSAFNSSAVSIAFMGSTV